MFDGLDTGDRGALVTMVGFALLVLMGLLPRLRSIGVSKSMKMTLSWVAIFGVLLLLVQQWPTLRAAIDPASPVVSASEMRVNARADGHFYVRARINGTSALFLVDTGASDVVLTRATAERVGLSDLRFDGVASTANGMVRTASVRLDELDVGGIALRDFPASVNAGELDANLLGMRFLNALPGWKVEGETLILALPTVQ